MRAVDAYTSPVLTASAMLTFIVLVDFFLVALVINRSLDMFRSLRGTRLTFMLTFAATAATGRTVEAGRQRSGR